MNDSNFSEKTSKMSRVSNSSHFSPSFSAGQRLSLHRSSSVASSTAYRLVAWPRLWDYYSWEATSSHSSCSIRSFVKLMPLHEHFLGYSTSPYIGPHRPTVTGSHYHFSNKPTSGRLGEVESRWTSVLNSTAGHPKIGGSIPSGDCLPFVCLPPA